MLSNRNNYRPEKSAPGRREMNRGALLGDVHTFNPICTSTQMVVSRQTPGCDR